MYNLLPTNLTKSLSIFIAINYHNTIHKQNEYKTQEMNNLSNAHINKTTTKKVSHHNIFVSKLQEPKWKISNQQQRKIIQCKNPPLATNIPAPAMDHNEPKRKTTTNTQQTQTIINARANSWPRFSNRTSPEGRELHMFCRERGLEEKVGSPTRNDHLLDLVLTDLDDSISARVIPGISDHEAVFIDFNFPLPEAIDVERTVFQYSKARWEDMRAHLASVDWFLVIRSGEVDASAERLTSEILHAIKRFIPQKIIQDRRGSHPWLDDVCRCAIRAKRLARGSSNYVARRNACSEVLRSAYNSFVFGHESWTTEP